MAKMKKRKKTANQSIAMGANRRAVAGLTRALAQKLDKLREQKALLAKQETNLFNQFKKDTGRSKRATKRALQFYFMEDSAARTTELEDQIETLRDLGLGGDLPLFKQAADEAALAADLERERERPGYIADLGRSACVGKMPFDGCPYPTGAAAKVAREKWEHGWLAEQDRAAAE